MKFYRPIKHKPVPNDGDTKKVKRFAWYPKRIGDTVIFLEHYNEAFRYITHEMPLKPDQWYSRGFELIHNEK